MRVHPGTRAAASAVLPVALAMAGSLALLVGATSVRPAALGTATLEQTRIEGTAFPKRLVDAGGISQTMREPPGRIASGVLAADEILTELVSPDRIVALTYLAGDPAISNCAGSVPRHAALVRADPEAVLSREPDLVFVAAYSRAEVVRLLLSAGIPVVRFGDTHTIADVMSNIRAAGAATGVESKAEQMVREMERRVAAVEQRVGSRPKPRVLYYSLSGFTAAAGTTTGELIERAGGLNVASEAGLEGWRKISLEFALGSQPDVLLLPLSSEGDEAAYARAILGNPAWQEAPAVRNRRVYTIRSAWLTTLSHHLVRGLEEIAKALHPEAFTS